ncbi:hypothetical protein [Senegalimassilia anaerobia]
MTEMTAETTTEIDDDITLADGKRTLTNSQLLILGFIASYGVAGCSESKRDIAEALQVSLKTVDRAILRLRKEGFIISVARYAENGMRLSNTYHVPTPEVKGEQLHAIAGYGRVLTDGARCDVAPNRAGFAMVPHP